MIGGGIVALILGQMLCLGPQPVASATTAPATTATTTTSTTTRNTAKGNTQATQLRRVSKVVVCA